MNNIFKGAKFGDKFLTRNNTIAYFDRYIKEENKYSLMVQDDENDFVEAFEDGHIFHPDDYDESAWKLYGYDRNDFREYKLDIVSRYHEPIDFDKLHELANKLCPLEGFSNAEEGFIDEREDLEDSWVDGFKAGYRKAKEE